MGRRAHGWPGRVCRAGDGMRLGARRQAQPRHRLLRGSDRRALQCTPRMWSRASASGAAAKAWRGQSYCSHAGDLGGVRPAHAVGRARGVLADGSKGAGQVGIPELLPDLLALHGASPALPSVTGFTALGRGAVPDWQAWPHNCGGCTDRRCLDQSIVVLSLRSRFPLLPTLQNRQAGLSGDSNPSAKGLSSGISVTKERSPYMQSRLLQERSQTSHNRYTQ